VNRAVLVLSTLTPAGRWRAVQQRDRRFDGAFVYAVRSTGIYCRPSCPSRRPRRPLVEYFALPEAAEAAGFRACRRCHPQLSALPDPAVGVVRDLCRVIDAQLDRPASLATLGRRVGWSSYQVVRAFRRVLGVTPKAYRAAQQTRQLKSSLKENRHVSPAIYAAGYSSPSRVSERAAPALGMTPATYGRGGRGMVIRFAVVPSPLGLLLVGATTKGVCRIALGDSASALERELRDEFPAADIQAGSITRWVRPIVQHLEGHQPHLDLPVDIRATAFQQRVWDELRKIPLGRTKTYQDVARAIGRPRATRAVARACATNPVAIVIPCHRVVPKAGDEGGYRWGPERKRQLLDQERSAR